MAQSSVKGRSTSRKSMSLIYNSLPLAAGFEEHEVLIVMSDRADGYYRTHPDKAVRPAQCHAPLLLCCEMFVSVVQRSQSSKKTK